MTDSFNITIPGSEIIKRLSDLEHKTADLIPRMEYAEDTLVRCVVTNYVDKQFEVLSNHLHHVLREEMAKVGKLEQRISDCELAVGTDKLDGAPTPNATYAYGYVVDDLTKVVEKLEQRLDYIEPLVQDCIGEALDAGEKADLLNDRVRDYTVALREMTRTSNAPANEPEPPVNTSWHPYDVLVDGVVGDHPTGDKHVVIMVRSGEIRGPGRARTCAWDERGDETIVAWRYAKAGE